MRRIVVSRRYQLEELGLFVEEFTRLVVGENLMKALRIHAVGSARVSGVSRVGTVRLQNSQAVGPLEGAE